LNPQKGVFSKFFAILDAAHISTQAIVTSFLLVSTSMTLNDLELSKQGFLSNFLRFFAGTHILRMNCAEMAGDGPGHPAYDIFSTEHFLRI